MKKFLLAGVLILAVIFTVSCSKPEKSLLERYFRAVQMQDNDTLSSMAVEPVSFVFTKWELKSVGEQKAIDSDYTAFAQAYADVEKELNELKPKVLDSNDAYEAAKAKKGNAAALAEAEKSRETMIGQYKEVQQRLQKAKDDLENVKVVIKKSLGEQTEPEGISLKKEEKTVVINIVGPTGAKDYNVIHCRYNIENGQMGRWIIEKFEEIK